MGKLNTLKGDCSLSVKEMAIALFILLSVVVLSFQLSYFRFSCRIFFLLLCFWLQLLCHVESSLAAITHGEDNSSATAHNVTAGIDGRL